MSSNNTTIAIVGEDHSMWFKFIAYWELCVALVGTPLNLLVIYVWSTMAGRRSSTTRHAHQRNQWFILSMTFADLLFTCVHAPLFFVWYESWVDVDDALCMVIYGATHLSTVVSSISLLLLNIDKFIYLHWPLHYSSLMTKHRAWAMTAVGWLMASVWVALFLFGSFVERQEHCGLVIKKKMFYAFFLVVFFLMPILLSTAISFYIAVVAVRARLAEMAATRGLSTPAMTHTTLVVDPLSVDDDSNQSTHTTHRVGKKKSSVRVELAQAAAVVPWRTITYVFSTTIWCTLTYLPYRTSLFVSTLTAVEAQWQMILFAIMVTYAAGDPIITIVTQPSYRKRVAEMFGLAKKSPRDCSTYYTGT